MWAASEDTEIAAGVARDSPLDLWCTRLSAVFCRRCSLSAPGIQRCGCRTSGRDAACGANIASPLSPKTCRVTGTTRAMPVIGSRASGSPITSVMLRGPVRRWSDRRREEARPGRNADFLAGSAETHELLEKCGREETCASWRALPHGACASQIDRGCARPGRRSGGEGPSTLGGGRLSRHHKGMTKILLVFHTSEGQTAKIADRVAAVLRGDAFDVELHDVPDPARPGGVRWRGSR